MFTSLDDLVEGVNSRRERLSMTVEEVDGWELYVHHCMTAFLAKSAFTDLNSLATGDGRQCTHDVAKNWTLCQLFICCSFEV